MRPAVQLMVLAPTVSDALPQILLFEDGIWRDVSSETIPEKLGDIQIEIEQHLAKIMGQVGADPPVPVPAQGAGFRAPFRSLYKTLLPTDVRNELARVLANVAAGDPPPLLQLFVAPAAEWIPWELLHDGTDFLGVRFAVARLPVVRRPTSVPGPRARAVTDVRSILANNVLANGDRDRRLREAWEGTFKGFSGNAGWERRFPAAGGNNPTLTEIEDAKEALVVHVTCHGGLSENQGPVFWTLDHLNPQTFNYRITADFAEGVEFARRPLVFGNACASVTTNLGALHGFGSSFMIGGALNFIGTLAPITKSMGISFARRFYEQLFTPGPNGPVGIADALRATKQSFATPAPPGQPADDPSYLFYCLYGPPDATYTPA